MSSITLNELSNYNNGNIVCKVFELDDFYDADDYNNAVHEWLEDCPQIDEQPCEEYNIASIEDVPKEFFDEHYFDSDGFYKFEEMAEVLGYAEVKAYIQVFGIMPEDENQFNEVFFGTTEQTWDEDPSFYIELGELLTDMSCVLQDVPEEITNYFDYEKYGRDAYISDFVMHDGYIFWNH